MIHGMALLDGQVGCENVSGGDGVGAAASIHDTCQAEERD